MLGLIALFSFASAFSLLWVGGFLFYIYAQIGFANLLMHSIPDLTMLTAAAFVPVIFLWLVVGLVSNMMVLKKNTNTTGALMAQVRRSTDHTESMVRALAELQAQTRSVLALSNAGLFIDELNDLLADIVVRFGLSQPSHTEILWQKVGSGNKWAFCKAILQSAENSPRFQDDLKNQMRRDELLSQKIHMFCYRFEQMFTLIERHDFEQSVTKIFEEGALGRVYLRFVKACQMSEEPQLQQKPQPTVVSTPETQSDMKIKEPAVENSPAFGFLKPSR